MPEYSCMSGYSGTRNDEGRGRAVKSSRYGSNETAGIHANLREWLHRARKRAPLRMTVLTLGAASLMAIEQPREGMAGSAVVEASGPTETNWAQWRGPGGQGVSEDPTLPTTWSAVENVRWKTAIPGRGHSSPIVWGDRIFLTTSIEGPLVPGAKAVKHVKNGEEFLHPDSCCADRQQTLKVLALDRDTGRIVWDRTVYQGTVHDNRHKKNTYASSTPVTDGKRIYAFFEAEGLYAIDFTGALVWKTSLGKIAKNGMGPGVSPILHGNLLILQCDSDEGDESFVAAVHTDTGKEVWRTPRRHRRSHATPVLVRAAGRVELVASGEDATGRASTVAYDPATGRELWSGPGLNNNRAIPSPVVMDDIIIVSTGYPGKMTVAFRAGGSGDLTGTTSILWTYPRSGAYVPSPILYKGLVYLTTDKGILTSLDARTGRVRYEGGRVPLPATFFASPVAFDGKLFLTSEDGDTYVIEAGPVHRLVATNPLDERVYASLALSQGYVFIRAEKHLYAIRRP